LLIKTIKFHDARLQNVELISFHIGGSADLTDWCTHLNLAITNSSWHIFNILAEFSMFSLEIVAHTYTYIYLYRASKLKDNLTLA
ncbi:MAG: hypothetical protein ACKPKO_43965, partial [Candidatus Fonsibacter sp.]